MAWTQLKNAINNAIKANNNQEITGPVLNSVLNSIVNSMGKYATFAGVATPSTNPGVFEGPVVYFANTAGAYPNFNNITVGANKIVALYNINGTWDSYEIGDNNITTSRIANGAVTIEKMADSAIDDEPTVGSDNLVKSGGVADKISELDRMLGILTPITTGAILGQWYTKENKIDYNDAWGYIDIPFTSPIVFNDCNTQTVVNRLDVNKELIANIVNFNYIDGFYSPQGDDAFLRISFKNDNPTLKYQYQNKITSNLERTINNTSIECLDNICCDDATFGRFIGLWIEKSFSSQTLYVDTIHSLDNEKRIVLFNESNHKYIFDFVDSNVCSVEGITIGFNWKDCNVSYIGQHLINIDVTKAKNNKSLFGSKGDYLECGDFKALNWIYADKRYPNNDIVLYRYKKSSETTCYVNFAIKDVGNFNYEGNIKSPITINTGDSNINLTIDISWDKLEVDEDISKDWRGVLTDKCYIKPCGLGVEDALDKAEFAISELVSTKYNKEILATEDSIFPRSYIDGTGTIYESSMDVQYIKIYKVKKGDKIRIIGNAAESPFTKIAFTADTVEYNIKVDILSKDNDNINIDWVAERDGNLLCWYYQYGPVDFNVYIQKIIQEKLSDKVEFTNKEAVRKEDYTNVYNAVLFKVYDPEDSSKFVAQILSASSDYQKCKIYKVKANTLYKINGRGTDSSAFYNVAFSRTLPTLNSYLTPLHGSEEYVDFEYTPDTDGYIVCVVWDGYDKQSNLYDVNKTIQSVQTIFPYLKYGNKLVGKTIAVLGDSIMNMMSDNCGTYSVTFTFKDASGNIYQPSEITVVKGYAYVSSSLVDGQPTNESIRVTNVNTNQDLLDSKDWEYFRKISGAKKIVNCSMGGSYITELSERSFITEYPETESGVINGLMPDGLPNAVRWLLRLYREGKCESPDCIVIWKGSNGGSQHITSSVDEVMKIDWSVLSDDTEGYSYREEWYGAMRFCIETLYKAFPFAQIVLVSPLPTDRGDYKKDGTPCNYRGYTDVSKVSEAMRNIGERLACPVLEPIHDIGFTNFGWKADTEDTGSGNGRVLGEEAMMTNIFLDDGLHPRKWMRYIMGNYLCSKLNQVFFDKKYVLEEVE